MKGIIITVSVRELYCFPDELSILSQSDDRQPTQNMFCTLTRELTDWSVELYASVRPYLSFSLKY